MKRLGQHFLKNKSALEKIAAALELKSGDLVIKIGAGRGELTEVVERETRNAKHDVKIIAIEKDGELAEFVRKKLTADKNIEIVTGDALKVIPQLITQLPNYPAASYKLVGNIPYYITGRLLRIIGELEDKPELCVFTLQKEVAERICAEPPRTNRLAASVQFWAEPEIITCVPRENFEPQPGVDSAIIRLKIKNQKLKIGDSEYYCALRALFAQPRKTILNNLATSDKRQATRKIEVAEKLRKIGIKPDDRPQDLSVDDIIKIAKNF